ncbi:hypothetical protein [Alkalihalobacterium alkalinitrilicum]|uniref:hypothetical protein n=1 Tax=Alkalihalobacterium alkalinitrilicum TaxID=427920 RepID=UPI00099499AA|nr:hypothetical protein [Alkalihalobacterium alkalinitrilicum]
MCIFRVFSLLIGFGLAVAGGVSLLAYLNLLTAGYDFLTYLHFISTRIELYMVIIGGIIITLSIYWPTKRK